MRPFSKMAGIVFIAASLLLGACTQPEKTGTEALAVATAYLDAMKKGDLDTAVTYLNGKISSEEWLKQLQEYQNTYGLLLEYQQRHTEENTALSGKIYVMEFHNTYTKAKIQETIILFQGVTEKDIKIMSIKHDVIGK